MDFIKYVNVKQGTKFSVPFSSGNTLPLCQRPFGFSAVAPQTRGENPTWFYAPDDRSFEGFRFTHQCSWLSERGAITTMPQMDIPNGKLFFESSAFNPRNTVLQPCYMKYYVTRCFADFEVTPTEYGAWLRASFDEKFTEGFPKYISAVPAPNAFYSYEYDTENERLFVKADFDFWRDSLPEKVMVYYVFQFEKGSVNHNGIIAESIDDEIRENRFSLSGKNTAIHIEVNKNTVNYRVAQSYIGFEQALVNLENDSRHDSFEALVEENKSIWNNYLGRVQIDEDENKMKTFYSCLYRALLYPHKAYETDKNGNRVHYSPSTDTVEKGVRYTDNGFWDTHRTVYPFFSIVYPEICAEMIEGFIQDYKDGSWLPRWSALGAKNCMPSTAIDAVIADLAVKGILKGALLRVAAEGMEKHANVKSDSNCYGRDGVEDIKKYGYVPYENRRESVNLTVDSSYHDYCIATVFGILGDNEKREEYLKRSENYRVLFDKETGFLRAKSVDGSFKPGFNPFAWASEYTEASAWPTTFNALHDFDGLAELYGGRDKLIEKLDELFSAPNIFYVSDYNACVHEMAELSAKNWGQCAISNQPSFHLPFIYAYFGEKEKADYWVEKIADEGFSFEDGGFPGDEDTGSMALWYVFSQIGLYPICPGKPLYTVTKPLVKDVKINGKTLSLSNYDRVVSYEDIMSQISE